MQPQALDSLTPNRTVIATRTSAAPLPFSFGPFRVIPAQRLVLEGGTPVSIGSRSFEILLVLLERAGEVVANDEIMSRVWPRSIVEPAAVRVHVAALRKALGDSRNGRRYISTVPQRGYCFVTDVHRDLYPVERFAGHVAGNPSVVAAPAGISMVGLPPFAGCTTVIGRERVMDALAATIPENRCLTIAGPGGVGKSSVALGVTSRVAHGVTDDVVYLDLASLGEAQSLVAALVISMGWADARVATLPDLVELLRSRQVLLLLDNCDPMIETVADISEKLLRQLPSLRIIATSREPLRIREERVERLPPLPVPPSGKSISWRDAEQYPAFELFSALAQKVSGQFVPSEADTAIVTEICRRLDGIPLALELAVAQIDQLGLRGLASALRDGRALPSRGFRTAPSRHRSIAASLDWSFRLLSDKERLTLQQLNDLPDRFTPESAEQACGEDVRETVGDLVRRSLLSAYTSDGQVYYGLFETTRAYLRAKVRQSRERTGVPGSNGSPPEVLEPKTVRWPGSQTRGLWRIPHCDSIISLREPTE